jgi:hypothetical protein
MLMRNVVVICLLAIVLMHVHNQCFSQTDVSFVAVRAGAIRSESITSHHNYLWSFYPEIEVGGGLFTQYLSWGVSWGYWTDGTVEAEYVPDFVQYSGRGHVLSARASIKIQSIAAHFPIPLVVSAGAAHIFSESAYVGEGAPWIGLARYTEQTTVGLLGLAVVVPVSSKAEVSGQMVQFLPFGEKRVDWPQTNRRAFTLGLTLFW